VGGGVVAGEVGGERAVAELGYMHEGFGLAAELDLFVVGDVDAGVVVADVGADVPGGERCLVGGVAPDEEDGGGVLDAVLRGEAGFACGGQRALESGGQRDEVGRAVVVDVVGADDGAGELLEEVVFLVGGAVGADDADAVGAAVLAEVAEFVAGEVEGFVPGRA
jgi:hypothetical protein